MERERLCSRFKICRVLCKSYCKVSKNNKIVVEKSTVPVRTSENKEILKSKNKNVDFQILSNPEFLAEGTAMRNLQIPDRVIIGGDNTKGKESIKSLVEIYASGCPKKIY